MRHVKHECVVSHINAGILHSVLKRAKKGENRGRKIRTNSGWLRMARGGSGAKAFLESIRLDTAAKVSGLPARVAQPFIEPLMMLNHFFFWCAATQLSRRDDLFGEFFCRKPRFFWKRTKC